MFTGIVQDIGSIIGIDKKGDWLLTIKAGRLSLSDRPIGASIACSGICLTVIEKNSDSFCVQASAETISKTTVAKWGQGTPINLEGALRIGDELGGHIVTGHVDGVALVVSVAMEGDSMRIKFQVPENFGKYIAAKGSVAIDGVSLTVNEVEKNVFGVNIIPHTQKETTLGGLKAGDIVNFEIDMMARYAERLLGDK